MDSKESKKLDTDNLSIYNLPALNASIDQFELPQAKGVDQKSETGAVSGKQ